MATPHKSVLGRPRRFSSILRGCTEPGKTLRGCTEPGVTCNDSGTCPDFPQPQIQIARIHSEVRQSKETKFQPTFDVVKFLERSTTWRSESNILASVLDICMPANKFQNVLSISYLIFSLAIQDKLSIQCSFMIYSYKQKIKIEPAKAR